MVDLEEVKKVIGFFSVIPLQKNKRPHLASWKEYQEKRPDLEKILSWHSLYKPTLWGIITGAISGLVILDFDGEKGQLLIKKLGFNPHVRTGSGGFHCYFKHPGWKVKTLNSTSKKEMGMRWPGLDIRADGGYAAFLGKNEKGPYEHLRSISELDDVALIPQDLKEFLGLAAPSIGPEPPTPEPVFPENGNRVHPEIVIGKALEMVSRGEGRNNAGFWLAAQLRDNRYSEIETIEIGESMYLSRIPDLNVRGEPEPYNLHEWKASVRQAFLRIPREPWTRRDSREPGEDLEEEATPKPERFKFYTTDEIADLHPPDWLIKKILPTESVACMYGPPGAGKSFIVLDMLMSIVCGIPWLDHIATKPGAAVYVVGEGIAGLSCRVKAWKTKFPKDPEDHPSRRLFISLSMPHFLNNELTEFMQSIERLQELPSLIVIDTLARCMVGGDENSAKDMGKIIECCEYLRAKLKSSILLVHHTGKGGDIRGSSALMGAIETCLVVSNDQGEVAIHCDKQKDAEPFQDIFCELRPVTVDEAENPSANVEAITSCIVWPSGQAKNEFGQPCLAKLWRSLANSSLEDGLTAKEWQEESGLSGRSFRRHIKTLVESGKVNVTGSGYGKRFIPVL